MVSCINITDLLLFKIFQSKHSAYSHLVSYSSQLSDRFWYGSKEQAWNGLQIDGYGSISGVFLNPLTLPISLGSCLSMCLSLFHLPCVSSNSKPLLFKYNLKMLHCCPLWPSVNNVLLLCSDWTKVKARLE